MNDPRAEITALLHAASRGERDAEARLLPILYQELRRTAAAELRHERPDHTLSPTALVNEAWLRLGGPDGGWQNRAHFFGAAAMAMRRILVDHARARSAAKRSRDRQVTLDPDEPAAVTAPNDEILAIDEALERLAALDARQAKVVELRYFVGLSVPATAEVLGVSPATVKRDWTLARAWLHRELGPEA